MTAPYRSPVSRSRTRPGGWPAARIVSTFIRRLPRLSRAAGSSPP
jgi:hypothetical protein